MGKNPEGDREMNQRVHIEAIKKNPNNPRIIKDDKFKKLVTSVKDFPQMLDIRPIVVNSDMVILGGNMRYAACKAAGMTEVPVIVADNLTEAQQREFVIKDNVSGGEWDWEMLANEWDAETLDAWGLDVGGVVISDEDIDDNFSLKDEEKAPFQQMAFVLSDEQHAVISEIIGKAKKHPCFDLIETNGNENSNGNALFGLLTGAIS